MAEYGVVVAPDFIAKTHDNATFYRLCSRKAAVPINVAYAPEANRAAIFYITTVDIVDTSTDTIIKTITWETNVNGTISKDGRFIGGRSGIYDVDNDVLVYTSPQNNNNGQFFIFLDSYALHFRQVNSTSPQQFWCTRVDLSSFTQTASFSQSFSTPVTTSIRFGSYDINSDYCVIAFNIGTTTSGWNVMLISLSTHTRLWTRNFVTNSTTLWLKFTPFGVGLFDGKVVMVGVHENKIHRRDYSYDNTELSHFTSTQLPNWNANTHHGTRINDSMIFNSNSFVCRLNLLSNSHEMLGNNAQITRVNALFSLTGKVFGKTGEPASRRIAILRPQTAETIASTVSSSTGDYILALDSAGDYTRVVFSEDSDRNDIADRVVIT